MRQAWTGAKNLPSYRFHKKPKFFKDSYLQSFIDFGNLRKLKMFNYFCVSFCLILQVIECFLSCIYLQFLRERLKLQSSR
jgi:hypothetical protein